MTSHPLAYYHPRTVEPLRPPNPFLSFYRQANRLFEEIIHEFDDAREAMTGALAPKVDVIEQDHQIRISAQLPDIRKEDIDVTISSDLLTIRAEMRVEQDDAGESRQVKESKFERTFRLPEPVEPERIRAHFTQGLLTIILPGADREVGEHKIAIDPSPAPNDRPDSARP